MQTAIARFLRFLHIERNASELTVKSYREDLTILTADPHFRRYEVEVLAA